MEEKINNTEMDNIVISEPSASTRAPIDKSLELSTDIFDGLLDESTEKEQKEYTTALLENVQQIEPTLSVEEAKDLVNYLRGSGRPEFMDKMMTQTNEKLVETIKIMAIFYLDRVPVLLDYQRVLQMQLINPENVKTMSYDEISKVSANVQKEINDLLSFALNVAKSLQSTNTTPTKVEKLANALMGVPEATRQRIEEIIRLDSQG